MAGRRIDGTGLTAGDARDETAAFLRRVRPAVDAEAVLLVVSELVTNAVRHAGGAWCLELRSTPGLLRVEVFDGTARVPEQRVPDLNGTGASAGRWSTAWPTGWRSAPRPAARPSPPRGT
ncbi:ATP-binding protein [Streptomyces sp. HB2AG]|uniref:ATP-binding protein n=1 Tax=Streptomyces sp. HB2AG TaxID=2983400 RepID=UPI0022AA0E52|nr:ATP-binding protein [Streptomyces sp. HB2AG]MCZ2523514.1 ATP-binding protein [Streptomyces sp. HB2AG]